MVESPTLSSKQKRWLIGASALHIVIAVLLSFGPETGDMDRYRVQAQLVLAGKNVYAEYEFYNYGPVWMYIVAGLYSLSSVIFRHSLAMLLGLGAVGTAWGIRRLYGHNAAVAFLLSPLCWLATGWFSMFDVLALGIAVWGFILFLGDKDRLDDIPRSRVFRLALILGASLILKHILIFYCLWLAFSCRDWWRRLVILFIPTGLFLFSFIPYLHSGYRGVYDHVFQYSGMYNVPWVQVFTGAKGLHTIKGHSAVARDSFKWLFYFVLLGAGWLARRIPVRSSLLIYTVLFIAASPTLHIYYTFIPLLFLIHSRKLWHVLFTASLLLFMAFYHKGGQGGFDLFPGATGQTLIIKTWYLEYWPTVAVWILILALADALWIDRIRWISRTHRFD
jgi:hypothetical protein